MNAVISPSVLRGSLPAPPSKSYCHRLLLASALAGNGSTVHGFSESEDLLATLDCVRALGAEVGLFHGTATVFSGVEAGTETPVLPCRESGSTMRFLLPVSLALRGSAELRGSERLMERGIGEYETVFSQKEITVTKMGDGISLRGRLRPGDYTLHGGVSSQFITGLLFALPLLDGDSTLRVLPPLESRPYVDITLDVLRRYGISIERPEETFFYIPGNQRYIPCISTAEGDWSNGAALMAFDQVQVEGLEQNSLQGDRVFPSFVEKLLNHAPVDLTDCPDLGPVLFSIAAIRGGGTFTGIRRLRLKESDRVQAMAEELQKLGISTVMEENRFLILPGTVQKPREILCSHNDHRIVMALTFLCSLTGGTVSGAECVKKSYPGFFRDLETLGLAVQWEP